MAWGVALICGTRHTEVAVIVNINKSEGGRIFAPLFDHGYLFF